MNKIIAWFSCGITSAVACKLAADEFGTENVIPIYIEIASAHEDNERFIKECEEWMGVSILRRSNGKYADQFEVIENVKYVNGPSGAACTQRLKKEVRQSIEDEFSFSHQVFGFEFDRKEINRAIRFSEQYPHARPIYPLIGNKLSKENCAGILLKNGIKLPAMYELGFHNNNCIGCVKGGAGYWNHIRTHFPEFFDKMASSERKIGRSCINGKFLDELSQDEGRHNPPILPDCGTFCEIEFAHIMHEAVEEVFMGGRKMNQLKLFR